MSEPEFDLVDSKGRPCVTIREAARRLKVSHEAVRLAIARGVLEAERGQFSSLIPEASLGTYVPQAWRVGKKKARRPVKARRASSARS